MAFVSDKSAVRKRPVKEHNSLQALMYCEEAQCSVISATRK